MSREPFFPPAQAQPAKKDKQFRSQSPRAPQSAVDYEVRVGTSFMITIVTQLYKVPQVRQVSEGSQDSQANEDTQVRQVPRYTIRRSTL